MSVITYLASDQPLPAAGNGTKQHLILDTFAGTARLEDRGDDMDFAVFPLNENAWDILTQKKYRAELEWNCTLGWAEMLLEYIRSHLKTAQEVEFWYGWQGGWMPKILTYEARVEEFTAEDIMEIVNLPVCTAPPVFHCVTIRR